MVQGRRLADRTGLFKEDANSCMHTQLPRAVDQRGPTKAALAQSPEKTQTTILVISIDEQRQYLDILLVLLRTSFRDTGALNPFQHL